MSGQRIPTSVIAQLLDEVDRELRLRMAPPQVLVAEPDVGLRDRAVDATQRAAPEVEVIAAATERAALAAAARGPALAWVADDERIDAALVVDTLRDHAATSSIWLRQAHRAAAPERTVHLGLGWDRDGDCLLDLFPRLAADLPRVLARARDALLRAEVVRRLALSYPHDAIRAAGFHVPRMKEPVPLDRLTAEGLADALRCKGGNVAAAARAFGVTRGHFYTLAARHGIAIDRARIRHRSPPRRKRA
jgi:hypothetical protein